MKVVQMYECEYCSTQLKSEKSILSHEKKCPKNLEVVRAEQEKKARLTKDGRDRADLIASVTSVDDFITKLIKYYDDRDIELVFNQYPCNWSDSVSNTHNAPKGRPRNFSSDETKPKGYPGWSGRWEGTIKYKNSNKEITLSDISGAWSNDKGFYPIRTGTGCAASKFSISGMLFIEDFPLMYEAMEGDLVQKEFALVFDESVKDLYQTYLEEMTLALNKDQHRIEAVQLNLEVKKLAKEMDNYISSYNSDYKYDYMYRNKLELPEVSNIFIDAESYARIKNKFVNSKPMGDISYSLANKMKVLNDAVQKFKKLEEERPHIFL